MSTTRPTIRLRLLRAAFGAAGLVAPSAAARIAGVLFCMPPRPRPRPDEETFLASGHRFTVRHGTHRLAAWSWGEGPTIVCMHGWGSRASRFIQLAPALVATGHRVVAFDAPGHGRSTGRLSTLPEFAWALCDVLAAVGPVAGIVGHSLGGAAVPVALSLGARAGRVVLLAPAADPTAYSQQFADAIGLSTGAQELMWRQFEARLRFSRSQVNVPALARRFDSPALIVHDAGDAEVPWSDGAAIAAAWPGAELVTTRGLSHRGLLRDRSVIERTIRFLTNGAPGAEPFHSAPSGSTVPSHDSLDLAADPGQRHDLSPQ